MAADSPQPATPVGQKTLEQVAAAVRKARQDIQQKTIGIACRKTEVPHAGVFVNTHPFDQYPPAVKGFCCETEFQLAKAKAFLANPQKKGTETHPDGTAKLITATTAEGEQLFLDAANKFLTDTETDSNATQAMKDARASAKTKATTHTLNTQGKFTNTAEVLAFMAKLDGDEASAFTRGYTKDEKNLTDLSPPKWHSQGKLKAMYEARHAFIDNGGPLAQEYVKNMLALRQMGVAVIESSSTDDKWGIKTKPGKTVESPGTGENLLGAIHAVIADEYAAKMKANGTITVGGVTISKAEIDTKAEEIKTAITTGTPPPLTLMEITRTTDGKKISVKEETGDKNALLTTAKTAFDSPTPPTEESKHHWDETQLETHKQTVREQGIAGWEQTCTGKIMAFENPSDDNSSPLIEAQKATCEQFNIKPEEIEDQKRPDILKFFNDKANENRGKQEPRPENPAGTFQFTNGSSATYSEDSDGKYTVTIKENEKTRAKYTGTLTFPRAGSHDVDTVDYVNGKPVMMKLGERGHTRIKDLHGLERQIATGIGATEEKVDDIALATTMDPAVIGQTGVSASLAAAHTPGTKTAVPSVQVTK